MKETIDEVLHGQLDRRQLLKSGGVAGLGLVAGGLLAGCGGSGASGSGSGSTMDTQILGAAKIAEALATTMYTSLINSNLFTTLPANDQAYFTAARDEEKIHYNLLRTSTNGKDDVPLTYYFPTNMFTDAQTTFNTLVTLEEAFIAAYLVGVKSFSTPGLRVLAAQIMGIESDHRVLARTAAGDLNLSAVTGLSGQPEPTSPPNNAVFERTFGVSQISTAVTALTPFFDATAAAKAGYTVSETFDPTYNPSGANLVGNPPA